MSLIPTEPRWKLQMPDGQKPKKPSDKPDMMFLYLLFIFLAYCIGITIGTFLGSIWPWPFS